MIAGRLKNEPLAYILSHQGFYGLDFKVSRHTLIPRPETELLVEEIVKTKPKNSIIIDVGTGSGNIIISLCKSIENKNTYYGADISPKALQIAKYNAKRHKLNSKIKFIKSDLLNYFLNNLTIKPFNNLIIVANLPYLSEKIYNCVSKDIKKYEPKIALLGGYNGLDCYKKLFKQIKIIKKSCYVLPASPAGGRVTCYVEISPEQKPKLEKILKKYFPKSRLKFQKDLAKKWRVVEFSI
jgi:release factor glutamine methyltransferase